MKFRLKTSNFAIFFAKKPDKTNTAKLVVIYLQMNKPIHFYNIFSKNLQTFTRTYTPWNTA